MQVWPLSDQSHNTQHSSEVLLWPYPQSHLTEQYNNHPLSLNHPYVLNRKNFYSWFLLTRDQSDNPVEFQEP